MTSAYSGRREDGSLSRRPRDVGVGVRTHVVRLRGQFVDRHLRVSVSQQVFHLAFRLLSDEPFGRVVGGPRRLVELLLLVQLQLDVFVPG